VSHLGRKCYRTLHALAPTFPEGSQLPGDIMVTEPHKSSMVISTGLCNQSTVLCKQSQIVLRQIKQPVLNATQW